MVPVGMVPVVSIVPANFHHFYLFLLILLFLHRYRTGFLTFEERLDIEKHGETDRIGQWIIVLNRDHIGYID